MVTITDESVDNLINMVETVHARKYTTFGLRRTFDALTVGDIAPASHDWDRENDMPSADLLDGACAVQVGDYMSWEQYQDALAKVAKYPGAITVLLGCQMSDSGDDDGETIMQDAEVIAIL